MDVMMVDELGMEPPEPRGTKRGFLADHWISGLYCFASFLICGSVPLVGYVAFMPITSETGTLFGISCGLTAATLFLLGALKSRYTTKSWWLSGLEILIMGAFTASAAYLIGWGVERLVELSQLEPSEKCGSCQTRTPTEDRSDRERRAPRRPYSHTSPPIERAPSPPASVRRNVCQGAPMSAYRRGLHALPPPPVPGSTLCIPAPWWGRGLQPAATSAKVTSRKVTSRKVTSRKLSTWPLRHARGGVRADWGELFRVRSSASYLASRAANADRRGSPGVCCRCKCVGVVWRRVARSRPRSQPGGRGSHV